MAWGGQLGLTSVTYLEVVTEYLWVVLANVVDGIHRRNQQLWAQNQGGLPSISTKVVQTQ